MKKHKRRNGKYADKKSRPGPEFKIEHASLAEIEARRLEIRRQSAEKHNRRIREEKDIDNNPRIIDPQIQTELPSDIPLVGIKDFVVKRNTFKCFNSMHQSENIAALIKVIPFGETDAQSKYVKVSAGYCRVCKVFFIMNSTYEKIRKIGIPECCISNEETYLEIKKDGKMKLARESILMQHGYNVNKIEGLTEQDRHKILAVLIDNRIVTKADIISYLDFFINQRANIKNMETAISKWEADRDFVNGYRIGEYAAYGVAGLSRRE